MPQLSILRQCDPVICHFYADKINKKGAALSNFILMKNIAT